jgi:hypothetical protein
VGMGEGLGIKKGTMYEKAVLSACLTEGASKLKHRLENV